MDKIEALGSSIAQISLYDLKSYYNQAKAVVLNYTEMEAKVRDATNDDAWGASSTLMQEIAQGTFNFQQFNEIMPTIYKRFTEKEAREWRQIYKALQLLEYLIKHGSERVIDDARSHISMIKILKNFHYVDDKGKDQGINVRNRAKEIAELLSDLDRVRQERRKAKASRSKYTGVGNDGLQFTTASGSKYGGFGSDSAGFSGGGGDDWNGGETSSRDRYGGGASSFKQGDDFEEYDAGEWEDRPAPSASRAPPPVARGGLSSTRRSSITVSMKKSPEKATPPPKAKEVDLFSMADEDDFLAAPPPSSSKAAQPQSQNASVGLDDDFDDFQSAPSANNFAATSPQASVAQSGAKPNVFALLNSTPPTSTSSSQMFMGNMTGFSSSGSQPPSLAATGSGGQFNSAMFQPTAMNNGMKITPATQASRPAQAGVQNNLAPSKAAGGAAFDDLFSFAGLSSGSMSTGSTGAKMAPAAKLSMAAMAREQSSASIWGAGMGGAPAGGAKPAGMGSMGGAGMGGIKNGSGSMGNNDDLLL